MQKPKQLRLRKYECRAYQKSALEYLNPPEDMKVSEWAERYRMLDRQTSAEPGPWNNSRTPYLVEIMDELLTKWEEMGYTFRPLADLAAKGNGGNETDAGGGAGNAGKVR